MGKYFNQKKQTTRRRILRKNAPEPERILWFRLKGKQLGYKFRRQFSIGPYIADFCCPRQKLIIEIDGESHFTPEAKRYDKERNLYIQNTGMEILRFTNKQVMQNIEGVVENIQKTIDQRRLPPATHP